MSENLSDAVMNLLRVRDEIERQAQEVLAEMDRKGELVNELPAAIAAALEIAPATCPWPQGQQGG